jgi:hypothetical protein
MRQSGTPICLTPPRKVGVRSAALGLVFLSTREVKS